MSGNADTPAPGDGSPDRPSPPTGAWIGMRLVREAKRYVVAVDRESAGLTTRYEAEAPTSEEARDLLRSVELNHRNDPELVNMHASERAGCRGHAAEKCAEHTICPELATQRETNEALERSNEYFRAKTQELKVRIAGLRRNVSERIIAEEKRKREGPP